MMLMNEATWKYVRMHADDDVRQLALRGSKDSDVDMSTALQQIAGLQIARRKLPSWAALDGLVYPSHLSMEQCSSEATARYKAQLAVSLCHAARQMVDLTGGFGVDFAFMAPVFRLAVYVEQQEELCRLAQHNFALMGINAQVVCADGTEFLHQMAPTTLFFLDPARRDKNGTRTYGIADCTPDVLVLRDELLTKADWVLLKLSPMLDWQKTVDDLGRQWVRQVHIVSVGGECKELLVLLSRQGEGLRLVCANDDDIFEVSHPLSFSSPSLFPDQYSLFALSSPLYLFEPNASIMKAGCFSELSERFGIRQIAHNSHLFISDSSIEDFPGRKFQILTVSSMNKRDLKEKISPLRQANIAARNFPLSVAELRKRLRLTDGGQHYLFATTLANGEHVLIVCTKA